MPTEIALAIALVGEVVLLVGTLAGAFLLVFLRRRTPSVPLSKRVSRLAAGMPVLFPALMCLGGANWLILLSQVNSFAVLALYLLAMACYITVFLTLMLVIFSGQLTAWFGKLWVKFLDYPYLVLATIGLLRVLNGMAGERVELIDTLGAFILAVAISVRLTKTTIEVFFDSWYNR